MNILEATLNVVLSVLLFVATWVYVKKKQGGAKRGIPSRNDAKEVASVELATQDVLAGIPKTCTQCKTAEGTSGVAKLSACGRCGLAVYCSKDCQQAHWKTTHKEACIAKAGTKRKKISSVKGSTSSFDLAASANDRTPQRAAAEAFFGATESERDELLDELSELSPEEKEVLMRSWGQLSAADLAASPTTEQLQASLKAHREEWASLMHDAAYKPLAESDTAALVARLRELKELVALEHELLAMEEAEDLEIDRLRRQGLKAKEATSPVDLRGSAGVPPSEAKIAEASGHLFLFGPEALKCLPCGPSAVC
jgi:hypothetical protein